MQLRLRFYNSRDECIFDDVFIAVRVEHDNIIVVNKEFGYRSYLVASCIENKWYTLSHNLAFSWWLIDASIS